MSQILLKQVKVGWVTVILLSFFSIHAHAQLLLNDFSDWTADNGSGGGFVAGSWTGAVVQNSGFISIVSPADDTGYIYLDVVGARPKDLTGYTQISLTARIDPGNVSGAFTVVLWDTNGDDAAQATFFASEFSGTFSMVTKALTIIDPIRYQDVGGFIISGNGTFDAFRVSFDSLSAIPEPSTYALLGLGLAGLVVGRRLRRRSAKA